MEDTPFFRERLHLSFLSPQCPFMNRLFFSISAQHSTLMFSSNIGPKLFSDHAWIESRLQLNQLESRLSSWSLNKSLLLSELNCIGLLKEMELFLKKTNLQFLQMPSCGTLLKHIQGGSYFFSCIQKNPNKNE